MSIAYELSEMQISNKLFSAIVNFQSHVNIMCFSPGSYQTKMATCISVLILYLCCTFRSVDGTNPGIIIQVTNKGLAYGKLLCQCVYILAHVFVAFMSCKQS